MGAAVIGLVLFVIFRPAVPRLRIGIPRTGWCVLIVAVLAIALRLFLLPRSPVPVPSGADDFAYILLADTLRHLRLANPPHALPHFFEQIFVLQQPTYSSMFNLGQGLALVLGWILFGHPWAGVLVSTGMFCAACCWMLRAWLSPGWAFAGGLLAIMQFGPLSYWTNSYWGGAVSATAGCLIFGALPRMAESTQIRYAVLLGLGLSLQLLTRPYEFLLVLASVALFLSSVRREWRLQQLLVTTAVVACSGILILCQNKSVTGRWMVTPYLLYRHDYGIPATFTFQRNPLPHADLNQEEELDYRAETAVHGDQPETVARYLKRLVFRIRFYRFFLFAPLYLGVLAFLMTIRSYRQLWIVLTVAIFALGSNFYPYFYPHYNAAVSCLILLMSLLGIEQLNRLRHHAGTFLLVLSTLQFLFWYSVHLLARPTTSAALSRYESWDYINYGDPQGRKAIDTKLNAFHGKLLVFVHYAPTHGFAEWVHNDADIDAARIVRVHDLGPDENEKLRRYYADRAALLLKPDEDPPTLIVYPSNENPFKDVQ